ncbi:MAG: DUF1501 domain-containing protein [Gemmatales bacterium]
MVRMESQHQRITRRSMLQLGAMAALSMGTSPVFARHAKAQRCLFLNLVGGPSHLDTWDPKPHAPSEFRGPFNAIPTKVPGLHFTELFPRMAAMADRLAVVRSVFHDAAPIHETGQQLIQQGQMVTPHTHCSQGIVLPGLIENTGVQLSHGQDGLQTLPVPVSLNSRQSERYGDHPFGKACLQARYALEAGHRHVTVNMFQTVYNSLSWDCHADGGELNVNLDDYRLRIAPMFDATYTALLTDLSDSGLLDSTLVVASGEFGRSPRINIRGGRDHWAGAWTALFAGAGVYGGQIIGATDRLGMEPTLRPVHASAIANTIKAAMGLNPEIRHHHGQPIHELFGSRVSS